MPFEGDLFIINTSFQTIEESIVIFVRIVVGIVIAIGNAGNKCVKQSHIITSVSRLRITQSSSS